MTDEETNPAEKNPGDVKFGPFELPGAYNDVKPVVTRAVGITDQCLEALENFIGLPLDFVNHHLATFRKKYRDYVEEIEEGKRVAPDLRIGSVVLREASFCGDVDELQEMFAKLLASASSVETKDTVHPCFASIITQLTPLEVAIFDKASMFGTSKIWERPEADLHFIKKTIDVPMNEGDFTVAVDNLVRLRLIRLAPNERHAFFTDFGIRFLSACVDAPTSNSQQRNND